MESWLPWCWAQAGPLSPPSHLRASQLLCLLLVPWTLQLAGTSVSSSRTVTRAHQRGFHPAMQLIPGTCLQGFAAYRLNTADFTG
jgi:cytosine/uracil/thiamine/allantoin permease